MFSLKARRLIQSSCFKDTWKSPISERRHFPEWRFIREGISICELGSCRFSKFQRLHKQRPCINRVCILLQFRDATAYHPR